MSRRSVQVSFFARFFLFFVLTFGVAAGLLAASPTLFSSQAHAQEYVSDTSSSYELNTDSDVPRDTHTLAQTVTLDLLSAFTCILIGKDPVYPDRACLGLNPETGKLGYAPAPTEDEKQPIGGITGIFVSQISVLYTPPATTTIYTQYLADNFGIVKSAYAQNKEVGGFGGLSKLFDMWRLSRDIAYSFLVIAFILIGVGVMLRIRIDPRTVMTIQNQIPRVVITMLLITFSYAIVGVMVDVMWATTYVGINSLTNAYNPEIGKDANLLSKKATETLLDSPLTYVHQVFSTKSTEGGAGGIWHVTAAVAGAIGDTLQKLVEKLLGADDGGCSWNPSSWGDCIQQAGAKVLGFVANVVALLIILCALLIALFRVWFMLIKAYVFLLFYTIAAPVWIAFGLLPGKPLGFENWIRSVFAKMAVFPLVALIFVGARILMDLYKEGEKINPNQIFVAPLVGNPNADFGSLLAFGAILMAPQMLNMLEEKMKVPGSKQGAAIGTGLAAGSAMATAIPKRQWQSLTSRDQGGNPRGLIARGADKTIKHVTTGGGKLNPLNKIPWIRAAGERKAQGLQAFETVKEREKRLSKEPETETPPTTGTGRGAAQGGGQQPPQGTPRSMPWTRQGPSGGAQPQPNNGRSQAQGGPQQPQGQAEAFEKWRAARTGGSQSQGQQGRGQGVQGGPQQPQGQQGGGQKAVPSINAKEIEIKAGTVNIPQGAGGAPKAGNIATIVTATRDATKEASKPTSPTLATNRAFTELSHIVREGTHTPVQQPAQPAQPAAKVSMNFPERPAQQPAGPHIEQNFHSEQNSDQHNTTKIINSGAPTNPARAHFRFGESGGTGGNPSGNQKPGGEEKK